MHNIYPCLVECGAAFLLLTLGDHAPAAQYPWCWRLGDTSYFNKKHCNFFIEYWQASSEIAGLFAPGIVRIARDCKLRVQSQVVLRGSVLSKELVFLWTNKYIAGRFVRSGLECKQCVQWPVSVQLFYVYKYKVILIQCAP